MNPTVRVFLEHILESRQIIQEYVSSMTKEAFLTSRQAQDAVIRRLEIIAEADYDLTWTITQKNIPELELHVQRILAESEG